MRELTTTPSYDSDARPCLASTARYRLPFDCGVQLNVQNVFIRSRWDELEFRDRRDVNL